MEITRRNLMKSSLAVGLGGKELLAMTTAPTRFQMAYAPHFGMFGNSAGNDAIDQLKFIKDQGFYALEDNGMAGRSIEDQNKIGAEMARLEIKMGVFVVNMSTAWETTLASNNADITKKFLDECRVAVDCAKRVNAKWMTVVCGTVDPRLRPGYQMANVVENLRRAAEIFEPHGLVMVLEPLNFRDHPNLYLTNIDQAFMVCRAVNSPSCKILFDMYHQQIQEGNIIPNIDRAWSEIAYFQIGDNPGRNEPWSGEMNYRGIFKHIHEKGYTGILGMEHGNSQGGKEGEAAVIQAYREADKF
jgi:hydroxypyruvate isomerase